MSAETQANPFALSRNISAPRTAVWAAFTEADRLACWWGPRGCRVTVHDFDLRPGGRCHYQMAFSNGPGLWGRFMYREISAPERLVWLNAFANPRGGIARAPFSELCPLEIENAVTLMERNGVTVVHLRAEPFGAPAAECQFFNELHPSLAQGYGGTFDQLEEYLAR